MKENKDTNDSVRHNFPQCAVSFLAALCLGFLSVTSASAQTCSRTCTYRIAKDSRTYNVTARVLYPCWRGWSSRGCSIIQAEIVPRLSPTTLSGSWGLSCGNTDEYGYAYAYANTYLYPDSYGDSNEDANTNGYANQNSNGDIYANQNSDTDRVPNHAHR
jgi:hypothetical protein